MLKRMGCKGWANTSQSIERAGNSNCIPCITPRGYLASTCFVEVAKSSSLPWLLDEVSIGTLVLRGILQDRNCGRLGNRSSTGIEKCFFQGMPVHRLDFSHLTDTATCHQSLFNDPTPQEVHELGGNSMHVRACAAAWTVAFSAVDLTSWNARAGTQSDR